MATCGTCGGTGRVRGQRKFSCHCGGYRDGCSNCGGNGYYYDEDMVPCTNLLCGGGTVPGNDASAPKTPEPSSPTEPLSMPASLACVAVGVVAIHIGNGMYAQAADYAWAVYFGGWLALLIGAINLAVRVMAAAAVVGLAALGIEWLAPNNPVSPLFWQGISWCWAQLRHWASLAW